MCCYNLLGNTLDEFRAGLVGHLKNQGIGHGGFVELDARCLSIGAEFVEFNEGCGREVPRVCVSLGAFRLMAAGMTGAIKSLAEVEFTLLRPGGNGMFPDLS